MNNTDSNPKLTDQESVEIHRPKQPSLTLNYVKYQRKEGDDLVLQLKILSRQIGHITIHPDGTINVRDDDEAGGGERLQALVAGGLPGVVSVPPEMAKFIAKLREMKPNWFRLS